MRSAASNGNASNSRPGLSDDHVVAGAVQNSGAVRAERVDKTAAAIEWLADQKAARQSAVAASPLGIHVVMGPGFPEMAANLERNLTEGRARLVQAIVRRI